MLAGDDVPVFEVDMLDVEGARSRFEVNLRPIWKDGLVIAAQGIARDVTVRTKLEQQVRQGQRMDAVGRLAGGVAHDFNNLLTVILGYAESACAMTRRRLRVRDASEIRQSAERAAALTRQLLAFSRTADRCSRAILDVNDTVAELGECCAAHRRRHRPRRLTPAPASGTVAPIPASSSRCS